MKYEIELVHNSDGYAIVLNVSEDHPVWKCLHEYYELQKEWSHLVLWEPVESRLRETEFLYAFWNLESEAKVLLSELFLEDFDDFYIN